MSTNQRLPRWLSAIVISVNGHKVLHSLPMRLLVQITSLSFREANSLKNNLPAQIIDVCSAGIVAVRFIASGRICLKQYDLD